MGLLHLGAEGVICSSLNEAVPYIFYSDKLDIFLKTKSREINFRCGISADKAIMPGFVVIRGDLGLVLGITQNESVFVCVLLQPLECRRVLKAVVKSGA